MEKSPLYREKKVLEVQGYPSSETLVYGSGHQAPSTFYATADADEKSHHHHHQHHIYIVYRRRWAQVLLYSLINMANAMTWITFSPIAGIIGCYYGVTPFWVDSLSLVFMVAYIPCFFLASWSLDSIGLRFGLIVGALITAMGAVIRAGAVTGDTFWVLFVGQTLCAIAQPFILNAPAKLAANWFPDGERTIATTLCVVANPIGVAIGFVLPPMMVGNSDGSGSEAEWCIADDGIGWLLVVEGVACVIVAVIFFFFFSSKPPSPPSSSQSDEHDLVGFWTSLKELFKDINFIILFTVFGLGLGAFNTMATLLPQILAVDNYSDQQSGTFGALLIILGLVGAGLGGAIVDKTHAYKLTILASLAIGAGAMVAFSLLLKPDREVLLGILSSILGFAMTATLPLCLELSSEIAYPIPEATPSGLLMTSGQIGGIVMVIGMDQLLEKNNIEWCNWIVTISIGVAFIIMLFFHGTLKRLSYEKSQE
eukprot:TRINITY_DN9270_c0_g1_i1.p1 TRINITY_DN9270_c0_g1~~TRINITY_DN9270_c0_g1_i1.p1  ORF type:complete len:481 (-),score=85.98 TRINITY_DN9270_c0_g1_i1:115-1557(-)